MPANSSAVAAIDKLLSEWDKPDSPGLAVAVVRDGVPLLTRCLGLANVEHGVANTTSTVFDIASMTKQFTAFAVLMLVRDGKLGLDDDVRQYLPDLPAHDPPIRVRHCLYHTSGLTDWLEALELSGPSEDYCSLQRAFRTITAFRETMFPAGQDHSYSNTGYVLLDWIVAHVAGKPMPVFLTERVFEPLGMSRSAFLSYPEDFFPNQAQGYHKDEDGRLRRMSWSCDVRGDGRMFTSIGDMTRWLQNFTGRTVGDAELFDLFFAPGRLDHGRPLRYAAGWVLDRYRGRQAIRHGGMGPGFQSHIAWFPEISVGVAILGNLRPCTPWMLANEILDALVGEGPTARSPLPHRAAATQDRGQEPADVCGRYFTATGLPVAVVRKGDRLLIDTWYERKPFFRQSDDVFRDEGYGDRIAFQRNVEGTVTHFELETEDGACPHMHGPIRSAAKFDDTTLDQRDSRQFEGQYLNDELDTVYTVVAESGGLIAKHLRCYDWQLRPIKSCAVDTFQGEFAQESGWPGKVTFERDSRGVVVGFRVRGSRMNVFFRKLSPELPQAVS